jgi:hypothetical protein
MGNDLALGDFRFDPKGCIVKLVSELAKAMKVSWRSANEIRNADDLTG